jgi:hypothetical protein
MKINVVASQNQLTYGVPIRALVAKICCLIGLLFPTFSSAATFNLVAGWNLMGNSSATPMDVASALGDASNIATVWKWNRNASKWAFYTPSMSAALLLNYTQAKGYDVLTVIDPKEGFWVNAIQPTVVAGPLDIGLNLNEADIQLGWNLLGSADGQTPSELNVALTNSLNSTGKTMTTTWAWDTTTAHWRFYSSALEAQGGSVLTNYVTAKGYLPFSAALSLTDGFWVNASPVAATGNTAPVANAGVAQNVVAGSVVTLDGSASSDANGDTLTYAWILTSKPAGSSAVLTAATSAKPTFKADVAGTYFGTLTVNDGKVNSAPVTVRIAQNAPVDPTTPATPTTPANPVVTATSVSQTVGPKGATLQMDGIELQIPAGALPVEQQITITALASVPASRSQWLLSDSKFFQFSPAGTVFQSSITVKLNAPFIGPGEEEAFAWISNEAMSFVPFRREGDFVIAESNHFSAAGLGSYRLKFRCSKNDVSL